MTEAEEGEAKMLTQIIHALAVSISQLPPQLQIVLVHALITELHLQGIDLDSHGQVIVHDR